MRNILTSLTLLVAFALSACTTESESLYRRTEAPEAFNQEEQTADFQQVQFNPSVDIIFVIDDSNSMTRVINNLSTNIDSFVQAFATHEQIDFHIGVVTIWDSIRYQSSENPQGVVPQTIITESGETQRNFWDKGELVPVSGSSTQRFISREPGYSDALRDTLKSIQPQPFVSGNDQTPGVGPRFEELLSPVISNLQSREETHPLFETNMGFWRKDSHKVFVFITDADDVTPEMDANQFDNQIKQLVSGEAQDDYSYFAVMHTEVNSSCAKDEGIRNLDPDDFKLTRLLRLTTTSPLNICSSNFGEELAAVGEQIRERTLSKVTIPLNRLPEFYTVHPDGEDRDWMEVSYGDQQIPMNTPETGWGWSYNTAKNILVIRGIDQMEYEPDAQFRAEFTALRFGEDD